jgi:hypothetical protein
MDTLLKAGIKGINEKYNKYYAEIETEEGLKKNLSWTGKSYKSKPKEKLKKYLISRQEAEIKELKDKIQEADQAGEFTGRLIITIEWINSRMWRANPRAYTNTGFQGSSISGCGYDKLSTATAEALNNDLRIMRLLYQKKDAALKAEKDKTLNDNDIHRKYLGYGSGYNILPRFEGGVGVGSHETIIKNLGLTMDHIVSTKNTDAFIITRE